MALWVFSATGTWRLTCSFRSWNQDRHAKENLMVVGLHAPSVVATERTSHSHLGLDVFLDLCMFRWDFMRPRLGGRDISSAWGYTEGAQHVMQTSSGGLAFFLQHPPKPARHLVRSRTRKHAQQRSRLDSAVAGWAAGGDRHGEPLSLPAGAHFARRDGRL